MTIETEYSSFTLGKAALKEIAARDVNAQFSASPLSLRHKLAATCRILFDHGHDSGLAGQISARSLDGRSFFTQRLGLGFDEITPDNILRVDQNLTVIEGEGTANPANRFHSWIYRARPDVACIVHTHPMHVCALSITGTRLVVAQMDACMLYDDVAFLSDWPGVPVGNDEGRIIAEALGARRAVILAHHGLVVAAASVEEACVLAIQCERAARMQLLAQAIGSIRAIDPHLAREAHDWILDPGRIAAAFAYFLRRSKL